VINAHKLIDAKQPLNLVPLGTNVSIVRLGDEIIFSLILSDLQYFCCRKSTLFVQGANMQLELEEKVH
jgi:hypothetical protein